MWRVFTQRGGDFDVARWWRQVCVGVYSQYPVVCVGYVIYKPFVKLSRLSARSRLRRVLDSNTYCADVAYCVTCWFLQVQLEAF